MFGYRREIDGLRALAVVPVVLFHAGFETFSGGFVGVDVFFVISGYLITSIILIQKQNGIFSLLNFYERRARRILPAMFFVIAVCIPYAWMFLTPVAMKDFSQSLVAITMFVSNILFWTQAGYFDVVTEFKPLLHTWSLAVEEQYYVLFPLFFLLIWRFAKRWTVVTLSVIAALSFALAQWGSYNKPAATFFLLPTRGWEIAIGALVAFYFASYPKLKLQRPVQETGGLIGLLLIFYAIFFYSKSTPFPSLYALAPTIGAALIILCTTSTTLIGRVLSSKTLVGIGLISYSTYLWHQPLFVFSRITFGHVKVAGLIFLSVLSLIFAYFTYRYIELPFRQNQQKIFKNTSLTLLIFSSIFFILFGVYGHFTNGIEGRLNSNELIFYKTSKSSSEMNCSLAISDCIAKASELPSVLLLGDSNAYHFSKSLKEVSINNKLHYYQLTMGGCLPLSNYFQLGINDKFNEDCISFNSSIKEAIYLNSKEIEVIVVSAAWLSYLEGDNYFKEQSLTRGLPPLSTVKLSIDGFTALSQIERQESFDKYISELLILLSSKTKILLVVGPAPPVLANFISRKSFADMEGVNFGEFKMNSANFNEVIERSRAIKFSYIDISKVLCPQDTCLSRDQYGSFYSDNTHFSDYGQRIVIKPLIEDIILKNNLQNPG